MDRKRSGRTGKEIPSLFAGCEEAGVTGEDGAEDVQPLITTTITIIVARMADLR